MGGCISIQISCDKVLNRVGSCLCGEGNHVCNLEKNLVALEKAMEVLKARRDDVLTRVQREEGKGQQRLTEVQVWLTSVETIEKSFHDLSNTRTMELQRLCLCGVCSKNFKSSFRYGKRVSDMLDDVENLKSNGVFEVVAAEQPAMRCVVEEMPLQQVIFGQEAMLDRAWNRLMDDETAIMGLYGMGGVGKTTLLTQISKSELQTEKIQDDIAEKIQDDIAEKLGLRGEEWYRKEKRHKAHDIHARMKNKKFVLLLDDIWRKVDLAEIGVPFPTRENGCKVVFTTRSREVCGRMGVDDPMEVQCLTDNEAWDLFKKKVGPLTLQSHPGIPEQARKVAEKCRGLPLALNVIGETMSSKRTIQEWHHAVQVLNSYASDFSGMNDQILPILKYSYDNLRGDQIKSCFEYCSLFPEDHMIEKEKLIDYWICEGFISENEDRERTINQGYEIIGTLVRACLLLEEGSNKAMVKMHDVVREMAIWISSDLGENREKCIVQAGVGLSKVPKVENWSAVERMSLMNNKIEKIFGRPTCPELTTLFLQGNKSLVTIGGGFFNRMPELVVLDLSQNSGLDGLPEEISELVSLKYLDLSGTAISILPVCLLKLETLMHLYLDDMANLRSIHGISKLRSLRVLSLLSSYTPDPSLMELLLLEHLKVLNIKIQSDLVMEELFLSHLARCIHKVDIRNISDLSVSKILRSFTGQCFPNLSSVDIRRCRGLKDLTWLLLAPNLIHLNMRSLRYLKEVVSKEKADEMKVQGNIPFEKLETLEMVDLTALKSIYWTPLRFPCLKEMYIARSRSLAKLPLDSRSVADVKKFVLKYNSRYWIEKVNWEDEATRLRFLPSCRLDLTHYE
ncbi:Disease resistance protein (NBS-LRR class) family [Raphanus sativus]|nr:Disease resistance protein (NBS-LRR class) family [Raphanus sativus]